MSGKKCYIWFDSNRYRYGFGSNEDLISAKTHSTNPDSINVVFSMVTFNKSCEKLAALLNRKVIDKQTA